jgi:predicted permease
MRDVGAWLREQLAPLRLPASRERKIVQEWAAQIEEAYDALREGGLADEDAWRELQRQLPDFQALGRDLLEAEPALLRMIDAPDLSWDGAPRRPLIAVLRESLTIGTLRDVRTSLRLLVKDRAFSATTILTLAVCLGANAAIFTVVHSVLLRPLAVPEPERIVAFGDVYPTITPNDILSSDAPSYFDRLEALTALDEQALAAYWYDTVTFDGIPEELRGMRATPSLFRLLRVPPALGRTFTDAEGEVGAEHKVILSHGLWQRLYGGNPAVVGRDLRLGWTGQPYTIVGVMPQGFSFFDTGSDGHAPLPGDTLAFWIPLALTPEQKSDAARTRYGFFHLGRLRSGATVEKVKAQVDALNAANFERFPQFGLAKLGMYTAVTPLQEALTRPVRRTLYLLWSAAGFVLLIGVINIANLSAARASLRTRELGTRLALGARRWHLTRQLVIEGLPPAVIGGVAGAAIGAVVLRWLSTAMENVPNAGGVRMDGTVMLFLAAISLLVGIAIGLAPAAKARALTFGQTSGDRTTRVWHRGLVVTQVALSVVLLIGATLLLTSLRHLLSRDGGFIAERVSTGTIFPPPSRYPDPPAVVALTTRILDQVRAIPGVTAAGITSNIALSGRRSPATVSAADRDPAPDEPAVLPSVVSVTPGYFEAMETPLVRGRYFTDLDGNASMRVAIVDERLAARLWPNEDPVGKGLVRGQSERFTIVGVVRNVTFESLADAADSMGAVYFPHTQAPLPGRLRWLAVKSLSASPATMQAVRAAIARIDPQLPLSDMQTMDERTSRSLVFQRIASSLSGIFGLVALFLSTLGVYGVLAFVVGRRSREIGIRIALGSTARDVFRLIFQEGLALIGAGLLLGVAGALVVGRALQGQVHGVTPTDPFVLGGVALITGVVGLLACLVPARRAARVSPVDVLTAQ